MANINGHEFMTDSGYYQNLKELVDAGKTEQIVQFFIGYLKTRGDHQLIESTLVATWTGRMHKDVLKSVRDNVVIQVLDSIKDLTARAHGHEMLCNSSNL